MKKPDDAYEGEWDFDGNCAPNEDGTGRVSGMETFTLGLFQWEAKRSGKGLKKGKVQKRVKGNAHQPAEAYAKAREICAERNGAQQAPKP